MYIHHIKIKINHNSYDMYKQDKFYSTYTLYNGSCGRFYLLRIVNSKNSAFLHTLFYTIYSLLQKGQKFIKAQEAIKIYDPNVFKTFNPLKFENKLTYLAINIPLRFIYNSYNNCLFRVLLYFFKKNISKILLCINS